MTNVFGPFASTIGLLAYVSLLIQIFVLATEVNVVRSKQLWPRALTTSSVSLTGARSPACSARRCSPALVDERAKPG